MKLLLDFSFNFVYSIEQSGWQYWAGLDPAISLQLKTMNEGNWEKFQFEEKRQNINISPADWSGAINDEISKTM